MPGVGQAAQSLTKAMGLLVTLRSPEQVSRFFDGLDLIEPGVVPVEERRPDSILDINSQRSPMVGGLARRPWSLLPGTTTTRTHARREVADLKEHALWLHTAHPFIVQRDAPDAAIFG